MFLSVIFSQLLKNVTSFGKSYLVWFQKIILPNVQKNFPMLKAMSYVSGNTIGGSISVQLTSSLTGLESAVNFGFYFQNRLMQTSQTGGQWYSDSSLFSIPWLGI